MRERLWLAVVAILICSLVSLTAASAQEQQAQEQQAPDKQAQDQSEDLKQLVREASAAYADGDFETAVDKLLAAYRLEPKARLLYNTARSYEELDRCRLALVYYRSFAQHEGAEPGLASKAKEKLASAAQCEEYASSLSGRLTVITEPPGATVIVDGRQVGTTPAEVAGIPSGEHTVSVELDGFKTASNTLDLEAANDRTVRATLVEAPDTQAISSQDLTGESGTGEPDSGEPDPGEQGTSEGTDSGDVNIPAVALVGAGVAGLGVGAYFDLVAIPDTDAERSGHAAGSKTYAELTDQRSGQATGALVGYISGGVLLAAGTSWLLLDLTGDTSSEASALRPTAAPREGGFVAGFEWQFE